MADEMTDASDAAEQAGAERMIEELHALRGKVARLQERVAQLDQLAHQDALIDLPNRRGFMRALERLIARVNRYDEKAAMLFVDIDGLKIINDSAGHKAGDRALIEVARLLVDGVRKSDLVARIGGDEFGILLAHADEQIANDTAARLVNLIAGCDFVQDGAPLPLSVAIGVGMISGAETPEQVMDRADAEMYRRKAA